MDAARSVTATFDLEPTPTANLSVTQTDSPDPVTAGNAIHYFVTVTNSGPDAANGRRPGGHPLRRLDALRSRKPWMHERLGRGDVHHRLACLRRVTEHLDRCPCADGRDDDHDHEHCDGLWQRG